MLNFFYAFLNKKGESMKLKNLLKGVKILNARGIKNVNIENISNKTSDNLQQGLYICIKGGNIDGHNLKAEAQKCGAVAFVVEQIDYEFDGLQILVEDSRQALSIIAKNFYYTKNFPKIIGVTGTNGKTTTTNMVAHILDYAGKKVGLIGTEGIFYAGKKINLHMTTPDPIDLFKHLKNMADEGVEYVVMEVSAHAIYLQKVFALDFFVKALTNITEDHLDFFETFTKYKNTKVDFIYAGKGIKIVNIDDKYGCNIASKNQKVFTYSKSLPADIYAQNIKQGSGEYVAKYCGNNLQVTTNLIGAYNIENTLCALLIACKVGISADLATKAMETFKSVDGRLNVYKRGQKTAIIDFAHTPDAMQKVLSTIRDEGFKRIICLFGCGGNRDAIKRPIMGKIASENADFVYISSDNPRFEEPMDIINQICSGFEKNNYIVIQDRAQAIRQAVGAMEEGDCLVLCGKGAEDYMEIKGIKYAYSDKQVLSSLGFEQI